MGSDIPEWFLNDVKEIVKHKAFLKEIYPNANKYEIIEGARIAFRILSKPENLMKFPEVAKLIEACKPEGRDVPNTILGEGFTVFNLNREKIREALTVFSLNKEKIDKALKPFKGGE